MGNPQIVVKKKIHLYLRAKHTLEVTFLVLKK